MQDSDLLEGARSLAIAKNMEDLRTVLLWLQEASARRDRLRHVDRAIELLQEIRDTIQDSG